MSGVVPDIRRIDPADEAGLTAFLRVRNAVTPDWPSSPERLAWEAAMFPRDNHLFLAKLGGESIGAASTGRSQMHGPEFQWYWLGIWVVPAERRSGVGSALLAVLSDAARAAGKTGFQTMVSEVHADGLRFLAARGFVEINRMRLVRLDLRGMEAPPVMPPAGIAIVTLAGRPDLVPSVHAVATEALPTIPTSGEPLDAGPLETWIAFEVERPGVHEDAFHVAVDEASGEAVGYASLVLPPGRTALAYHAMTAVRPAYRGRGIATALKRATIAWAIGHGLETLEASNDENNAPMRAVNAALGYGPMPDLVGLQGPLAPPR